MRVHKVFLLLLLAATTWVCFPLATVAGEGKADEGRLEGADAVRAMAIANEWKWSRPEVKSYVTSREVVFEFPNGRRRVIPLPQDKMVVAVAPFVSQTHR